MCAAAVSVRLERIGRWRGREIDASQAERLGRSCLSIVPCSRSHAGLRRNATMSHAFSMFVWHVLPAVPARALGHGGARAGGRPSDTGRLRIRPGGLT
ncbi:hypothetical protein EVAR_91448_1 [Eumeta japonica]|uniref:Uncharacterized protein n=1 Tax=Eumeta variegata TaxID=151549 RepID=A0A4C1WZ38_EUMVA|nr:hypothetical protein EVAR_91448_1 [Eumeta japonica]